MKITAVLVLEKIEPVLSFWVDRMGFIKTVEVPEGNSIGFAILARDGAELMLQTVESVHNDAPQLVPKVLSGDVGLYVEVDDFDDVLTRLEGYPIALEDRTTFYGMREVGVRDPSGHTVIFASRM